MATDASQPEEGPGRDLEALLAQTLLLDLEVSHEGRIRKLGAVLGPTTLARAGSGLKPGAGDELATLARSAWCVLGHNLVRHDLPALHDTCPQHPLLRLPVIDTLVLSPLTFPENPYHRLVKDYKLVRESVNDPVADARQAAALFGDEFRALAGLRRTEPRLFELLHFLLATPDAAPDPPADGMAVLFRALRARLPSRDRALELCRQWVARWACRNAPVEPHWLLTSPQRHALAYALTWLRVAGSNSVLPPWVRLEHPGTLTLIRQWREVPCAAADCAYCRRVHSAASQLRTFFGFDTFRPEPRNARGGSLQQDVIEAGLRDASLLAILPTGAGKSLCFQLPALTRNHRRGVLTIVLSPLQALMKDQVDGLVRRTGITSAAALSGLLTPPERGDVLRRIVLGDVALLYVSPEQLRNRSFREAVRQREIGCWVFDEAHCLSKWGHDFRPDYLYAGRFIKEFAESQGGPIPPIACFTATAKQDVKDEILKFFRDETGRELRLFEGGVERDNLRFEVQLINDHTKLERVHDLLADRLPPRGPGSAIVFRATREATIGMAGFLQAKGWAAAHFHAGLEAPEKKRIQDAFLDGELRVICATNAFGMGIDKDDIRLVIHADTPGSLENYLQEAGRAGRDGQLAECILLYDEEDCEQQFRLGALSELSRRDIAQILRGLRRADRTHQGEVVITTGEILRDEDLETTMTLADRNADTKVRTAIAWLERAGFLQRDENVTQVFQARLLVRTLAEAQARMAPLNLPRSEQALWEAILRELMNAPPAESLTVDRLALLPEFALYAAQGPGTASPEFLSAKVLKTLGSMAQVGLLKRDLLLNAFVRHKVADPSRLRLERVLRLERLLLDLLATEEPDPEGWMPLNLRLLNQRLCDALGSADPNAEEPRRPACSVEAVRTLLQSLSQDGRGFAGSHGSIDLRCFARDSYRVRVRRSWSAIQELAEKRRRVAAVVLDTLLAKVPAHTPPRADLLVEFAFEELQDAVNRDLVSRSDLKDLNAALERALMYLHEQQVITLQQGLAVFRSAMRIRLAAEAKQERYTNTHYQPLAHHYRERVFQVHVMSEYARRGLAAIGEAVRLVLAYFSLGKEEFLRRYLPTRPALLEHATTAQSFQRIVTDLNNRTQIRIVTAPLHRNLLVLAGPGSGKTRTVVHRCAYLLRVERVHPRHVLVCCFNRRAALELRRRLKDLVGADARGVMVLTYHALAMRLLGYSFGARRPDAGELPFDRFIADAVKLLRGETVPPGLEPDEVRDRLLAGFQYILVDEYQDIDEPQYQLISALAGRTLDDPDQKLAILAVGDDDQNIYTFRGANVAFIRRFQQDYAADVHYLVENYRSTRCIIEASNQLIAANTDRMKTDHPICIDRHRSRLPAGGAWTERDPVTRGRVRVIQVPDSLAQAAAVIAALRRLREGGIADWSAIAVLSRGHEDLLRVRALAEQAGIPVRWWESRHQLPPLHRLREIHRFLGELAQQRQGLVRATDLVARAEARYTDCPANPWAAFLRRTLEAWVTESDDAELPVQEALEFLYESCAESRRDLSYGEGVTLSTVHAAKGTEHDHVILIGRWPLKGDVRAQEEERRVFYVGMTRARHSLTVLEPADVAPSLPASLDGPSVYRERASPPPPDLEPAALNGYEMLPLEDVHLSYAGNFPPEAPIHRALRSLQPGDRLTLRTATDNGLALHHPDGTCVARLSRKGNARWADRAESIREARVVAMVQRSAAQDADPERRDRCRAEEWEVPLVELVYEIEPLQGPAR